MDDRPSAWLAGAGLGLCLGSGVLLAAYAGHVDLGWGAIGVFLGLFTFGLGIAPFAEWGARFAWAIIRTVVAAAIEARSWFGGPTLPQGLPETPQDAPAEPEETYTAQIDHLTRQREFEVAHWQVYYRRIVAAGCAYGWDIRTLTDKKRETRVTTQPGWNLATDMLAAAGVLVKDQSGTRLAIGEADWSAERLWERVPCPDGEPPEILPPPYSRQQTRQNTQQTTVEGVAADA